MHRGSVWSNLDDNILHVSVNVGHTVEKLERKRAAVSGNVTNDPVIFVRRFHDVIDRGREKFHGQNFVLVAPGYTRSDRREIHNVFASPFGHKSLRMRALVNDGYRFG